MIYFHRFMTESPLPHYKVVLVGNSGCGKTAIITRWTSNTFVTPSKPTIGSNHERKRVDLDGRGPVDLYVWDTAGQEQFQSLIPLYARSSCLAIVTTSVDDLPSFQSIPKWIDAVASSCETPPPVILAVNKIDLTGEDRKITVDEIHRDYDDKFSGIFFVSALTGEGISELFNSAAIEATKFSAGILASKTRQVQRPIEQSTGCC
jgi:small GTP-binding protein